HVIFETYAELTWDIDPRLIAENHVGFERRFVFSDEVGPLVTIHSHAVTQTVRKVFVVWAVTGICDDFSRGCIDAFARHAGASGPQRGTLGSMHDVENRLHFVAGVP